MVDAIKKFAVGIPSLGVTWLLWTFLDPLSLAFLISITILFAVITLIVAQRYTVAAVATFALVAYLSWLTCTASYVILADQPGIRYREVAGVSYLVLPSALASPLTQAILKEKLISILPCDGTSVARLPLLPFAPLSTDKNLFDGPFAFRRFAPFEFTRVQVSVETGVGSLDGQKEFTVGFSFNDPDGQISITDLFPRSLTCTSESIPLVPVMEMLPWDPDRTDSLILAVSRIRTMRDAYLHHTVTIDTVKALTLDSPSRFKSLLDFASHALLLNMLQGNVFAEARADLTERICAIVENDRQAFSGPFAELYDEFLVGLAIRSGERSNSLYPICYVSKEVLLKAETISVGDGTASLLGEWLSSCPRDAHTRDNLLTCLDSLYSSVAGIESDQRCKSAFCGVSTATRAPSEHVLRFYESKFDDFVLSDDRKLLNVNSYPPGDCPQLRDEVELKHFLSKRTERARSWLRAPLQCDSVDLLHKFFTNLALYKSVASCQRQRGLTAAQSDRDADDEFIFDFTWRCAHGFDEAPRAAIWAFDRLNAMRQSAPAVAQVVRSMSPWIGDARADGIIGAINTLMNAQVDASCYQYGVAQCKAIGDTSNLLGAVSGIFLDLNALAEPGAKGIYNSLSGKNNLIADIALCDALAFPEFAAAVGVSRESFCVSRGLGRHMAVAQRSVTERHEFDLPGGSGNRYVITRNREASPK